MQTRSGDAGVRRRGAEIIPNLQNMTAQDLLSLFSCHQNDVSGFVQHNSHALRALFTKPEKFRHMNRVRLRMVVGAVEDRGTIGQKKPSATQIAEGGIADWIYTVTDHNTPTSHVAQCWEYFQLGEPDTVTVVTVSKRGPVEIPDEIPNTSQGYVKAKRKAAKLP